MILKIIHKLVEKILERIEGQTVSLPFTFTGTGASFSIAWNATGTAMPATGPQGTILQSA